MKERAYAKINLSLDVFNVREDGYHDIRSIMLPIDFYDELEIKIAEEDSHSCNRLYLPFDERNSILKMIGILKERYDLKDHYAISLNKQIPTKAGLGGGTADAAATLKIFEKLYDLHLSREEIIGICLKVGADVPFNYFNTPALVSGIGDVIEEINVKKTYPVLLVKPRSGVSTKEAYDLLDMGKCDHPDIDGLKKILENGEDLTGHLGNSLEQPAMLLNRQILRIINSLKDLGAKNILMSGSGSTVFCIEEDEGKIRELSKAMEGSENYVRFTRTLR